MTVKEVYQKLLDSGNTGLENRVNEWLWNYAGELGDPEKWDIYTTLYPDARLIFTSDEDDINKYFEGVSAYDIAYITSACDIDMTKEFLIENLDVSDMVGNTLWSVDTVSDAPGWSDAMDNEFEICEFDWVDEDEFFKAFPELNQNDTESRLYRKVNEFLAELQKENGIKSGYCPLDLTVKFDERLEGLASVIDEIISFENMRF